MTFHPSLLHELPIHAAERSPDRGALTQGGETLSYSALATLTARFRSGMRSLGVQHGERWVG